MPVPPSMSDFSYHFCAKRPMIKKHFLREKRSARCFTILHKVKIVNCRALSKGSNRLISKKLADLSQIGGPKGLKSANFKEFSPFESDRQ